MRTRIPTILGILLLFTLHSSPVKVVEYQIKPVNIHSSGSQVLDISLADPEDDVMKLNSTTGEVLQTNLSMPDFDITNVTVTTNDDNYTIKLYIKGNFNLSYDSYIRYNVYLYWNWTAINPWTTFISYVNGYELSSAPYFWIYDPVLGDKVCPSCASFNSATHTFSMTFNRSWIADTDPLNQAIDEFWINVYTSCSAPDGNVFRDNITNGWYLRFSTNSTDDNGDNDPPNDPPGLDVFLIIGLILTGTVIVVVFRKKLFKRDRRAKTKNLEKPSFQYYR